MYTSQILVTDKMCQYVNLFFSVVELQQISAQTLTHGHSRFPIVLSLAKMITGSCYPREITRAWICMKKSKKYFCKNKICTFRYS